MNNKKVNKLNNLIFNKKSLNDDLIKPKGYLLIAGITGSGSTTMKNLLQSIKTK